MLYHGTAHTEFSLDAANPTRSGFDLCCAFERAVAESYGAEHVDAGADYRVLEVELVDEHLIWDEDEVWDELDAAGYVTDIERGGPYFYLVMDDEEAQDILREAGIDVVEYDDEDWDNERHMCVRILDAARIKTIR